MDQELFDLHVAWAQGIARQMHLKAPLNDLEHLQQVGLMGLSVAAKRFNPAKGTFKTFAKKHVFGAVMDEIRKLARKAKRAQETNSVQHTNSVSSVRGSGDEDTNHWCDPVIQSKIVENLVNTEECEAMLERIPPRTRKLVIMHVIKHMSFKEISKETGLSAWQVSRRVRMALKSDEAPTKQTIVLNEMTAFYTKNKRGPTCRELMNILGWTRPEVDNAVIGLRQKGLIKHDPRQEVPVGIPSKYAS